MTDPATVRAAVREIRREGYKAAFVYAVVDAAAVALAVNLALAALVTPLPDEVTVGSLSVAGGTVLGLAAGLVAFAAEFAFRARRPTVERFERLNPGVREALRTARDAARDGADTRMARVLYADVVRRLRETSSVGLVDVRRVAATVLLVLLLGVATVSVSVANLDIDVGEVTTDVGDGASESRPTPGTGAGGAGGESEFTGLQPGAEVLGEPEDVTAGAENVSARVEAGTGPGDAPPSAYDESGTAADAAVDPQEAGFEPPPEYEDAEVIREYNLRIRNQTGGGP